MLTKKTLLIVILCVAALGVAIFVIQRNRKSFSPIATSTNKEWKQYTFDQIGLSFSAPADMTVDGEMADDGTFTLYVQRSSYPDPTYYQLYGLFRFSGNSVPDIEGVKSDLIPDSMVQKEIAGFKVVQGQYKGERSRLATFIFTNKGLFTLATSQPSKENGEITNSIVDTFKFK